MGSRDQALAQRQRSFTKNTPCPAHAGIHPLKWCPDAKPKATPPEAPA